MYGAPFNSPDQFEQVINYAAYCLKDVDFETLVFRGFSGAVVGPAVALKLKKRWVLVRKPDDNAHSGRRLEGMVQGKYVIIDDFIDSGATIKAIVEAINVTCHGIVECVGVVLYEQAWCHRQNDRREFWESKVGGVHILNWPAPDPISKPGNFMAQSSSVGKIMFPKRMASGDYEWMDYADLLNPPPMPPSLMNTCEEIAF
jgi:adenine/guanine phosphoribosyltransferase-like PRPP-binding protein